MDFNNSCVNKSTAGFDNGELKLFDLRTNAVLWETAVEYGICSVQFDRKDIEMNKLVVTTLAGNALVYDMRTFNEKSGYAYSKIKCHDSTVWKAGHLPQDRDIWMTSGGNGSLELWQYKYPSKRQKHLKNGKIEGVMGESKKVTEATISEQPITGIDWSIDKKGLGACVGLDQKLSVFIVTKLNLL